MKTNTSQNTFSWEHNNLNHQLAGNISSIFFFFHKAINLFILFRYDPFLQHIKWGRLSLNLALNNVNTLQTAANILQFDFIYVYFTYISKKKNLFVCLFLLFIQNLIKNIWENVWQYMNKYEYLSLLTLKSGHELHSSHYCSIYTAATVVFRFCHQNSGSLATISSQACGLETSEDEMSHYQLNEWINLCVFPLVLPLVKSKLFFANNSKRTSRW